MPWRPEVLHHPVWKGGIKEWQKIIVQGMSAPFLQLSSHYWWHGVAHSVLIIFHWANMPQLVSSFADHWVSMLPLQTTQSSFDILVSFHPFLVACQPSGAWLIKSLWCMLVCGQGPPRIGKILKFISEACTWWKMIDPPVWLTIISPNILEFRFNLHMVKDDWPPSMTDQDLT